MKHPYALHVLLSIGYLHVLKYLYRKIAKILFLDLHTWWIWITKTYVTITLQWRHNERDGVSNHRPLNRLFNRLLRRRPNKTSKLRATGLCEGNPPVTGGFPSQRASNRKMFPFDDVIMKPALTMVASGNLCSHMACCPLCVQIQLSYPG